MSKSWQKRQGERVARENARSAKVFIANLDKVPTGACPACKRWVTMWAGKTDPIFERVLTEFWYRTRSQEKTRTEKVKKLAAYWERLNHSVRTQGTDVRREHRYHAVLPVISWVANTCGRGQVSPTAGADFVYRLEAWGEGKIDVERHMKKHVPYLYIVTNNPHVTVMLPGGVFRWIPAAKWRTALKSKEHAIGKGKDVGDAVFEITGGSDEDEAAAVASEAVVIAEESGGLAVKGLVRKEVYVATPDVLSETTFSFYPTIKNRMSFANRKPKDMSDGDMSHAERVTAEVRAEPDKKRRSDLKRTARAVSIAKRYRKDKDGKPVLGKSGMPVGDFTGWAGLDYDRGDHAYLTDKQFRAVFDKAVEVSRGTAFRTINDGFCVPLWIGISRDDDDFTERAKMAGRWLCDHLNDVLECYTGHGVQVDPSSLSPNQHRYISKEFVGLFRAQGGAT